MTKKKTFKRPYRSGMIVSVNTAAVRGHKTKIRVNKKGLVKGAVITHSPETSGKKNIKLQENPQVNHAEEAYVVRKRAEATVDDLGKIQNDVVVKNPIDKSIMRHIIKKGK